MHWQKAEGPRPGGVLIKFFQIFWENMGPTIVTLVNQAVEVGFLHKEITLDLLILLHKRGDVRLLRNKRGLTLLNTIYKIMSKALQLHLSPILMRIILV